MHATIRRYEGVDDPHDEVVGKVNKTLVPQLRELRFLRLLPDRGRQRRR
jgi:hypothetical protein